MSQFADERWMSAVNAAPFDAAAAEKLGSACGRIGLPAAHTWRQMGFGKVGDRDYFLEVSQIGVVGGFSPTFDWSEEFDEDEGVYVWPIISEADRLSAAAGVSEEPEIVSIHTEYEFNVRANKSNQITLAARPDYSHKPTAVLFFERHASLVGDRLLYYVGDLKKIDLSETDASGEKLELSALYATASLQIRADWMALVRQFETLKLTSVEIVPIIIADHQHTENLHYVFEELLTVAVRQFFDENSIEADSEGVRIVTFEEPIIRYAPEWMHVTADVVAIRARMGRQALELVLREESGWLQRALNHAIRLNASSQLHYDNIHGLLDVEAFLKRVPEDDRRTFEKTRLELVRKVLIELGVYRLMSTDEIAAWVKSNKNAGASFTIAGVPYIENPPSFT